MKKILILCVLCVSVVFAQAPPTAKGKADFAKLSNAITLESLGFTVHFVEGCPKSLIGKWAGWLMFCAPHMDTPANKADWNIGRIIRSPFGDRWVPGSPEGCKNRGPKAIYGDKVLHACDLDGETFYFFPHQDWVDAIPDPKAP